MKTISFTGTCPQCSLYDEEHFMLENNKFWECPNCNLQILVEKDGASIFRYRGEGIFKFNNNKFKGNVPYQEVGLDNYPNGTQILIDKHLVEYLLNSVEQKPKYSIDILIDSYIEYKFNNGSAREYLEQVLHHKFDFDSKDIIEILRVRDNEKNYSFQYETSRLYYFLVDNVFPKFANNDCSNLPEMGMSNLQLYLCKKHFPNNEKERIDSNELLRKQTLKNLIKDLISIIYFDKDISKILFSGDVKLAHKIKLEMFNDSLN